MNNAQFWPHPLRTWGVVERGARRAVNEEDCDCWIGSIPPQENRAQQQKYRGECGLQCSPSMLLLQNQETCNMPADGALKRGTSEGGVVLD